MQNPGTGSIKNTLRITLEGKEITNISSFYRQMNDRLMQDEDWKLAESLDAFDDLLYGGFGKLKDYGHLEIEWKDIDISRKNLGVEITKAYYLSKIYPNSPYNQPYFKERLEELERGAGNTYFDLLMEIIDSHSQRVRLFVN